MERNDNNFREDGGCVCNTSVIREYQLEYGCEGCSHRDHNGNCWKDAIAIKTDSDFSCYELKNGLIVWL